MSTAKHRPSNRRLAALNTFLAEHGFTLDGDGGLFGEVTIGSDGYTAVWDKRASPPRIIPDTVNMVENYRRHKDQTPGMFLAELLRISPHQRSVSNDDALASLAEDIQSAASDLSRNSWRVGDGLNAYYGLLSVKMNNEKLSFRLNLGLTPQRVGQLRNTAEFFTAEHRANGIAFEVYAEARKRNDSKSNGEKLDAAQLAALVKAHPSVAAIATAMTPPKPATGESKLSHDLRLHVSVKDGKHIATVTIDGQSKWNAADTWVKELVAQAITKLTQVARLVGVNSTDPATDESGEVADETPVEAAAL